MSWCAMSSCSLCLNCLLLVVSSSQPSTATSAVDSRRLLESLTSVATEQRLKYYVQQYITICTITFVSKAPPMAMPECRLPRSSPRSWPNVVSPWIFPQLFPNLIPLIELNILSLSIYWNASCAVNCDRTMDSCTDTYYQLNLNPYNIRVLVVTGVHDSTDGNVWVAVMSWIATAHVLCFSSSGIMSSSQQFRLLLLPRPPVTTCVWLIEVCVTDWRAQLQSKCHSVLVGSCAPCSFSFPWSRLCL